MIILQEFYNGDDLILAKINNQIILSGGRETFDLSDIQQKIKKYNISQYQQEQIFDSAYVLLEESDLEKLFTIDARFLTVITDTEILTKYSQHEDERIRECVAHNPHTPPSILEKLGEDKEMIVLYAVALNSETPPAIIEKLSNSSNSSIKIAVACNQKLTEDIIIKLSKDPDDLVRSTLASRQPKEKLQILQTLKN